jgi:hypothetical protein
VLKLLKGDFNIPTAYFFLSSLIDVLGLHEAAAIAEFCLLLSLDEQFFIEIPPPLTAVAIVGALGECCPLQRMAEVVPLVKNARTVLRTLRGFVSVACRKVQESQCALRGKLSEMEVAHRIEVIEQAIAAVTNHNQNSLRLVLLI